MEDLKKWLTIEQMAEATGKSTRTIERLIEKQLISTASRPNEGTRSMTVIDPAEVEKHRSTRHPRIEAPAPVVLSEKSDSAPTFRHVGNAPGDSFLRRSDARALLAELTRPRVPISEKMYLTTREAALLLGFPHAEVVRLVARGILPTITLTNGWRRIARRDVEHYVPTTRQDDDAAAA